MLEVPNDVWVKNKKLLTTDQDIQKKKQNYNLKVHLNIHLVILI